MASVDRSMRVIPERSVARSGPCRAAREAGATAIEYAAIAGLISIAGIVGMTLIGEDVIAFFDSILNAFP
jgi:Flp pilus assembly pilin Flp